MENNNATTQPDATMASSAPQPPTPEFQSAPPTAPETPEPQSPEPIAPEPKTRKSNKVLVIILSVVLVAIIGVVAYMLLKQPEPPKPVEPSEGQQQTPETEETSDEEKPISSETLIRELNYKVAALLSNISSKETSSDYNDVVIKTDTLPTKVEELYENSLSDADKQAIAIKTKLQPADFANDPTTRQAIIDHIKVVYSQDELSSSEIGMIDGTDGFYNQAYADYSEANDFYKELFGGTSDLPQADVEGDSCFEVYWYVNNIYVDRTTIGQSRCGGAGFPVLYTKKNSYSTKGDTAYVYVSVLSAQLVDHPSEEGEGVYLFNGSGDIEDLTEIRGVGAFPSVDDITEEDWTSAAKYRFVFEKNANGTHHFAKLEKL